MKLDDGVPDLLAGVQPVGSQDFTRDERREEAKVRAHQQYSVAADELIGLTSVVISHCIVKMDSALQFKRFTTTASIMLKRFPPCLLARHT